MNWTNDLKLIACRVLNEVKALPKGAAACFVPLTSELGIKLFAKEEWRDFACEKQKLVFSHSFAPRVGESFILPKELWGLDILQWSSPWDGPCPLIYGYITQRADTSREIRLNDKLTLLEELKRIPELQTPADFEEQDDNFGYIGDQLVVIDFDEGSWTQAQG